MRAGLAAEQRDEVLQRIPHARFQIDHLRVAVAGAQLDLVAVE